MKCSIIAFAILLAACDGHVDIVSAKMSELQARDSININTMSDGTNGQEWQKIELIVRTSTLLRALRSESTVFADVVECGNLLKHFPSIAFVQDIPLDEQQKHAASVLSSKTQVTTLISAYAPSKFMNRLDSTCVRLTGGSYAGARLQSNVAKVDGR